MVIYFCYREAFFPQKAIFTACQEILLGENVSLKQFVIYFHKTLQNCKGQTKCFQVAFLKKIQTRKIPSIKIVLKFSILCEDTQY